MAGGEYLAPPPPPELDRFEPMKRLLFPARFCPGLHLPAGDWQPRLAGLGLCGRCCLLNLPPACGLHCISCSISLWHCGWANEPVFARTSVWRILICPIRDCHQRPRQVRATCRPRGALLLLSIGYRWGPFPAKDRKLSVFFFLSSLSWLCASESSGGKVPEKEKWRKGKK